MSVGLRAQREAQGNGSAMLSLIQMMRTASELPPRYPEYKLSLIQKMSMILAILYHVCIMDLPVRQSIVANFNKPQSIIKFDHPRYYRIGHTHIEGWCAAMRATLRPPACRAEESYQGWGVREMDSLMYTPFWIRRILDSSDIRTSPDVQLSNQIPRICMFWRPLGLCPCGRFQRKPKISLEILRRSALGLCPGGRWLGLCSAPAAASKGNRNGSRFLGYTYFSGRATTKVPKRISALDSSDMQTCFFKGVRRRCRAGGVGSLRFTFWEVQG